MDMTSLRAWLGEQTTIQGLMCVAGGVLWGWFHGDWATGGTFIGIGAVAVVMRESPAEVVQFARSIITQAQTVKVQADTVKAEAAAVITAPAPAPSPADTPEITAALNRNQGVL